MKTSPGFDHCLSFINLNLKPAPDGPAFKQHPAKRRAITLSRQSGSGGAAVTEALAAYMDIHAPREGCPWTVFDRNLVERVLQDHHLPQRLSRFMTEDRTSDIADIMDELFGLHPSSVVLVRKTSETILHLAEMGNVILIGRGASVVTAKLEHVFHVRLVGSLEVRTHRVMDAEHLEYQAALERIHREDRGRARYLKTYFDKNIDDPLLYDLMINTDHLAPEETAKLIGEAVIHANLARPVTV